MEAVHSILNQAIMITGFVVIMMMVIEYLNVLTGGRWDMSIAKRKSGQLWLCSFLGATPGCLGAYAVGSFYVHRVISIGTLFAAMFATCGDESFVMLALYPKTALAIFGALFVGGVLTGKLIDFLGFAGHQPQLAEPGIHQTAHPHDPVCIPFSAHKFREQWRNCSPQRGWLTFFLLLFMGGILSGSITHEHHHSSTAHGIPAVAVQQDTATAENSAVGSHHENHDSVDSVHAGGKGHEWNWVRVTFLILTLVALAIVASVPDHFLEEHLWNHLIKVHAWRIMLWTVGALAATYLLVNCFDISRLIDDNRLPLLLTACLAGLLPTSGPHLIFVTLYAQQALPLSVLMANCIIQDGHGLLPTLAHSRRTFVFVKSVKFIIGLTLGIIGHLTGW